MYTTELHPKEDVTFPVPGEVYSGLEAFKGMV
jgi:hypothetical protein